MGRLFSCADGASRAVTRWSQTRIEIAKERLESGQCLFDAGQFAQLFIAAAQQELGRGHRVEADGVCPVPVHRLDDATQDRRLGLNLQRSRQPRFHLLRRFTLSPPVQWVQ